MEEIVKDLNKWTDTWYSLIGRSNIKILIFSKLIITFNTIPIKIPPGFSVKIDKLIFKIRMFSVHIYVYSSTDTLFYLWKLEEGIGLEWSTS